MTEHLRGTSGKWFSWNDSITDSCVIGIGGHQDQMLSDYTEKFSTLRYETVDTPDTINPTQFIIMTCKITGDEHWFRFIENLNNY